MLCKVKAGRIIVWLFSIIYLFSCVGIAFAIDRPSDAGDDWGVMGTVLGLSYPIEAMILFCALVITVAILISKLRTQNRLFTMQSDASKDFFQR